MTGEETIFAEALARGSATERAAYLDEACAGNVGLRHAVDKLLLAHQKSRGILDSPPATLEAPTGDAQFAGAGVGATIGRYKLLELIGEGGYGTVFMAEQTAPVHRKVALKIIKAGMDTRQVIARFEAERQALALMEHPNIARVFDAGVTETGRPYFVMELVKGTPITTYCDDHKLNPRERLELFVSVCHAVQHAHQKGIIHRDLKPTNVLVAQYDGRPVPKVIDFGVAKATGQRLTDRTMFTGFGDVIGTPQYMSPEQAELNQLDVDTRSDIYSLGVLLYELLTGTTPLDAKRLKQAALLEVLRVVREEEPQRPSTRLSTVAELPSIAAQRGLEPKKLSGLVHGELDWIVMKALEKDRGRRYETANGFARDVERYLADEPVLACPPSARYRLGKFARRHRVGLLATAGAFALLLLLVAGLAVSNRMILAERNQKAVALEERERALARAEAESKRAEDNFLRAGIAIREVLTKAAMGSGEWSQVPPPLRKRFSEEAVKFYESLSQVESQDPNLKYQAAVGHRAIGTLHVTGGAPAEAEQSFRRSISMLDGLARAHPDVAQYRHQLAWSLYNLGRTLRQTKRGQEAGDALERSVALYEALLRATPTSFDFRNELSISYRELLQVHRDARDFRRGGEVSARLISMLQSAPPPQGGELEHTEMLASAHYIIGHLRATEGRVDDAKASFREAARCYEEVCARQPTARTIYHLASCHEELMVLVRDWRQLAEMEQEYRKGLDVLSRTPPELKGNRDLRERLGHLKGHWGYRMRAHGRPEDAKAVFTEAADVFDKLAADEPGIPVYRDYANASKRQIDDLNHWLDEIARHSKTIESDPTAALAWTARGWAYTRLEQPDKALGDNNEAIRIEPKGAIHWNGRSVTYMMLGKPNEALADCDKAIELDRAFAPAWFNRGWAYRTLGRYVDAAEAYLTALRLKSLPQRDVPRAQDALTEIFESMRKSEPGNPELRRLRAEADALREPTTSPTTARS